VHGDWKSIELPIPEGREMLSVFRGARPRHRPGRHANFDAYLLDVAVAEGARVLQGEVQDIRRSGDDRPVVCYAEVPRGAKATQTVEADFVVIAGGVNEVPGMDLESSPLLQSLRRAIPGFRPPRVRRTLICELQLEAGTLRHMRGEVHFAQYGSRDVQIEMSSLIPKGEWLTLALLGPSVDRAEPSQRLRIVKRFLQLPHIRRLLPKRTAATPTCACSPNMTTRGSRHPAGDRIALIGDMAVSRLYKDGIYSAYATATGLAECILTMGIDRRSLEKGYLPVVRSFERDNKFGALVFLLNRLTFSRPALSRILYQAVLTEKKVRPEEERRLASVLWRIASGDDSYLRILRLMFHPQAVWAITTGGLLVTARNYLTERALGLRWEGFGRHPTGIPREEVEKKRGELIKVVGAEPVWGSPDVERMYSIRIRGGQAVILHQLGEFGNPERHYFKPRLVTVQRTSGSANEVGCTIQYDVCPRSLSFSVVLEQTLGPRGLIYRVQDGFAAGGVLAFGIEEMDEALCVLSIYVAFQFPRGRGMLARLGWRLFGTAFPAFVHDVVWNHSLCELKHVVEMGERGAS